MDQTQGERTEHRGDGQANAEQVIEELRLLLDALAYRAEDYLLSLGREAGRQDGGDCEPAGTCGWCPVCAVAAVLRGERPELTTRLAEQLAAMVTLLRQVLAEHHAGPAEPASEPPAPPAASEEDEPPAEAKVQRIEVRRVSGRVLKEDGC